MKSLPKGHMSILSSLFRYTPAANTDIRQTFERIRGKQAIEAGLDRLELVEGMDDAAFRKLLKQLEG